MHLSSELNEAQQKAVKSINGPLLILAGAGAGKTKTITHRILHLVQQGVDPRHILAITFTNKAAKEMRERTIALLRQNTHINRPVSTFDSPFVSTFHSLGVHILKENSALLELPRHFTIFDKNDSKKAVQEALKEAGLDPKQFEPRKILGVISKEKGKGVTCEEFERRAGNDYLSSATREVWRHYSQILKKEKALDFDDLLLETALLLKRNEAVLKKYQDIWKYIHIDEYQDTNGVQYVIAKMLAHQHKNVCAVGDIDQNIYSWRGAQLKNILNFEKDYPNAQTILLEQNYRSTKKILSAANGIISKNKFRKEKNLFTQNPEGENIGILNAYDEIDEADFVADKCKELISSGVSTDEISVLYRANFQSRALEEAFLKKSVDYQLLGTRFFERKEVRDILSYIKAALNPESTSEMKRIINTPKRGIGKVTLLKVLEGKHNELPASMREKVSSFFETLRKIKETAQTETPSATVKFVLEHSGIGRELARSKNEEDQERLENASELVSLAIRYDHLPPEEGIEKLLTDASLASDQDEIKEERKGVKLMTVHASKGLEFDYVFITGLEDGLFPHGRTDVSEASEESEEERRLFYVALTRARKKLFLTHSQFRTIFGQRQACIPSDFISDIDESLTEEESHTSSRRGAKPLFRIEF